MAPNRIAKFGLLGRLFRNVRLLIPLMWDFVRGRYRDVSARSILIFVATVAYILSPFDFLPDYVLGLGQLDDVALLGLGLYFLEKDLMKYQRWRQTKG